MSDLLYNPKIKSEHLARKPSLSAAIQREAGSTEYRASDFNTMAERIQEWVGRK